MKAIFHIRGYLLPLSIIILIGCNGNNTAPVKQIELIIKFSGPPKSILDGTNSSEIKYSDDIINIGKPIKNHCKGIGNVGFEPIIFERTDIDKRFRINYFVGEGIKTFIATGKKYNRYFRDSLANRLLLEPANMSFDISSNLSSSLEKSNYFIYSTDDNLKITNKVVYTSIEDLRNAIIKSICEEKITKVVVLYEPSTQSKDTSGGNPPPIPDGLRELLLRITQNSDPLERRQMAEQIMQDSFTTQLYVKMYRENRNSEPEIWDYNDGKNYILKRLTSEESIKDIKIWKLERSNTDNKISYLELTEMHKQ